MSILQRLQNAVSEANHEQLRLTVADIFWNRPTEDVVPLLSALLVQDWHHLHEDIAHTLQQFKDARAISELAAALQMRFEYIDESGSPYALKRKCTWALADIGGSRSKQILVELCHHSDPELASYAQKRIDNWEAEAHRKGTP